MHFNSRPRRPRLPVVLLSTSTPQSPSSFSTPPTNISDSYLIPPHVSTPRQSSNSSVTAQHRHDNHLKRPCTYSNNAAPQKQRSKHNAEERRQNLIRYMFRTAKNMERQGRWGEALSLLEQILQRDPKDAHSHLALARLESRREGTHHHVSLSNSSEKSRYDQVATKSKAQIAFETGIRACPDNVHLLQGFAIYEQSRGKISRARELFDEALALEPHNPFVCHAYSLMEKKMGNDERAVQLIQTALSVDNVTAALVCTLGEWLIAWGELEEARELYSRHLPRLTTEKDQVEVYLASAWLEERYFHRLHAAQELLQRAKSISPTSSLASVAVARLEGRIQAAKHLSVTWDATQGRTNLSATASKATAKRLAAICEDLHQKWMNSKSLPIRSRDRVDTGRNKPNSSEDGRVFNALATLEIKQRRFVEAQEVLRKGMDLYPFDHNLLTAAGKVEEHLGNYSAARRLYGESLRLEPSSPTLVSFALLELNHPDQQEIQLSTTQSASTKSIPGNYTFVKGLFEEALLLDPRNGPAYNAYGNAEARRGNISEARSIFERGVQANCSDMASIFHGYGMLELSLGNVEKARTILHQGLECLRQCQDNILSDIPHRDRAKFLSHTLGMLELKSNRPSIALEIFQDGIERSGNSSRLLLGAALCEMRLGKDQAARTLLERSIIADKRHAEAWQAWGAMETRAGNFQQASTIFQKGIRNAPQHASLWHGYATLEMKRGNVMNARTLFAAGLKKASQRQFALFQGWATLELREGNYQAARKLISESLTRNKKNGMGWIVAAQIEGQDGHHSGLVSLILRRGIECDPHNAEVYRELGEYFVGQGKIADAREVFEKGMEMNPMYAPLYHSMAELEARICNLEGLAKLNKRAAELFNKNALEPSPISSLVYGTKIKAKMAPRHNARPSKPDKPVSVFATKIVDDSKENDQRDSLLGLIDPSFDAFSILDDLTGDDLLVVRS